MRKLKYTAVVPKTYKAVKKTRYTLSKKLKCLVNNTKKRIKKMYNVIDRKGVNSIKYITKKRCFSLK